MGFSGLRGRRGPGTECIPKVNVDYIGYHLSSLHTGPVTVDGLYISFDRNIDPRNAVLVSLLGSDNTELCYYAASDVSWDARDIKLVSLTANGGSLPTADQVYYVKVALAAPGKPRKPWGSWYSVRLALGECPFPK